MDTDCQMVPVGEAAIMFMKKVLGSGLTLSRLVEEGKVVEDNGETVAFLTEDSDVETIRNFTADQYNRGYVVHSGYTDECLASYIWNYLKKDENRLCLMQNREASPNNPWLEHRKSHVVFLNEEVYHVASKMSGSAEAVLNAIREAEGAWIFFGILTQAQNTDQWMTTPTITVNDFEDVVKHITHVFVMAFDGEGYVVWQAKES